MNLDPRTIFVINIISAALFGIGLWAVSRSYLRQIRGIRFWAGASILHALGWLMYVMRGIAPDFVSYLMAQTCILFSLAFYYIVIAEFTGNEKKIRWVYYLIGLAIAGLSYYLWVVPNTAVRIAITSGTAACLLIASAHQLLRGNEKKPAAVWFTGLVFSFSSLIFFFRAGYYLFWETNPNQNVFAENAVQTIWFLTAYLTASMLTFGFLLMSYHRYISQHEEIEEKLVLNEKMMNEAQHLAKVGSWEFNLDTGELIWSKEQYSIFEMEEAPADKLFELCRAKVHPDDLFQMDEAIRIAREKDEGVIYEHRIICKDGSIKNLLGIGDAYKSADGKKNMLRGTVQDVTEQKKEEEIKRRVAILESKSKEMEQFVYIASHDLREPLLTIKNYAELFAEENSDKLDSNSAEYLIRISRAANRMDDLIHGLLDYSRVSKIKELQSVDTNQLVQEVLDDIAALVTSNNAKIIVEQLPVVTAYPMELKQLFQNLLTNAIKFRSRKRNPEIKVNAKQVKGVWTFEVSDNGIGIVGTEHEKIFGLFQRAQNKSEYAGSGIGLAICKKIAELHHGVIWVESIPEYGSKFCFTIVT